MIFVCYYCFEIGGCYGIEGFLVIDGSDYVVDIGFDGLMYDLYDYWFVVDICYWFVWQVC